MKESSIDWIGQIPEEWRVRPIKHIVETPVTDGPHETPVLYETGIPFLSAEAVKDGVLDFNYKRGYISLKDHDRFKKKISPKKDDIFIVKSGATTGNVGIVNTDEVFDIWSPLALIRCNKTLAIQKYIYFYLLSTLFKSQVEFNWSFGTQQNIGMGVIERIKVILPPVSEQQKIVEVLDKKTAQLDKAKALLEEQIQKLKDYRASLIYETVTKGLDKTVPLKDSGIDWIGQVPEGWGVSKLKNLLKIKDGTHDTPSYVDSGIPLITTKNINSFSNYIDFSTAKNISYKDYILINRRSDVEYGDILMPMIGTVGGAVQVITKNSFSIKNVALFKAGFNLIMSKYLYYQLNSALVNNQLEFLMSGGVQSFVSISILEQLQIINPSDKDKKKIVRFLDKKTQKIDKLIQIKNQQIENIDKQRQTLIYDYVTGKRRV